MSERKLSHYVVKRGGIAGCYEYVADGSSASTQWTLCRTKAFTWKPEHKAVAYAFARQVSCRVVPVYVRVIKKRKPRDVRWALVQMAKGHKVRCDESNDWHYLFDGLGIVAESVRGRSPATVVLSKESASKSWRIVKDGE